MRPTIVRAPLTDLSDDSLQRREALYLRLLHAIPTGPIAERLYLLLNETRLAMFARSTI